MIINLHLHTSASDGCDDPEALVAQLHEAGIGTFAVTDHDTVAGLDAVAAAARDRGLGWIPGIEITAVEDERDVHVLAYGFDVRAPSLLGFLAEQRASRLERIREFARRFDALGMAFDVAGLLAETVSATGRSVGRAHVARALVAAGHSATVDEAFDRWLARGRPGFVPRRGVPVRDVVARIHETGGIAALAHPRLIGSDDLVARLLTDGLDALEAYHSDHDVLATEHYAAWARRSGLAVSGGSDFHGVAANRSRRLGDVSLPAEAYDQLRERAAGGAHRWPEAG